MATRSGGPEELQEWLTEMITEVAPELAGQLHAKIHLQVVNGVVRRTPVGNPSLWESPPPPGYTGGRARGNWQSSIFVPKTNELPIEDASGQSSIADGENVARRIQAGDVSYITNNVPYIIRLNQGWSTQAPAAFVDASINEVVAQFGGEEIEWSGALAD